MIRRRRPQRRIEFSFDSFLDVVANVVGIILRLILIAWVGARSYKGPPVPAPAAEALVEVDVPPLPVDPLAAVLEEDRRELARAQADLLSRLKELNDVRGQEPVLDRERSKIVAHLEEIDAERARLDNEAAATARANEVNRAAAQKAIALSLEELRERRKQLVARIDALKREPAPKRDLRYRTPVSAPVQTEELMFEVRNNRVTLVDVGALIEQVRRNMREKGEGLRSNWEVTDTTGPAGAFRLRYTLERERGSLDTGVGGPTDKGNFSISMTYWEAQPITSTRGEPSERALAADSAFRRIVDQIDAQQTAVTFWVYPDSFAAYRQLRDYLHQKDVVVAGRPLEEGQPIAGSSKFGKRSRGQ